jgi:hypothetical protein
VGETVGGLIGDAVLFFFLAIVGEVLSSLLSEVLEGSSWSMGVGEGLLGVSNAIRSSDGSIGVRRSGPTSMSSLEMLESILDTSIFSSLKSEYRLASARGLLLRVEGRLEPRRRGVGIIGVSITARKNGYRGN